MLSGATSEKVSHGGYEAIFVTAMSCLTVIVSLRKDLLVFFEQF
jgi:hypothetical protein